MTSEVKAASLNNLR